MLISCVCLVLTLFKLYLLTVGFLKFLQFNRLWAGSANRTFRDLFGPGFWPTLTLLI